MVSNARDDLPLPLGPVTTVSFPSGRSRSIPLRLFWRAPRISIESVAAAPNAFGVAHFFSAIFEPTGDYPSGKQSWQILQRFRAAKYLAYTEWRLAGSIVRRRG